MNRQQRRLQEKTNQKAKPAGEITGQVGAYIQAAAQSLQSDQAENALYFSEQALLLDPTNLDAQFNLNVSLIKVGQYDRAEVGLSSLVKRQPTALEPRRWLCHLYLLRGKLVAAKRLAQSLANDHPKDIHILRMLTQVLYQVEDNEAYIEVAQAYLALSKDDTAVKMELASVYTKADLHYDAISLIETFIFDNIDNSNFVKVYTNLLINFKEFDKFLEFMRAYNAINKNTVDSELTMFELSAHYNAKDSKAIETVFYRLSASGFKGADHYMSSIKSLISLDDVRAAVKCIRFYKSNIDNDFEIKFCLARAFFKRTKFRPAIRILNKLIEVRPDDILLLELLLMSHLEQGQRHEARRVYEHFSHVKKYQDLFGDYIFRFFDPEEGFDKIRNYFDSVLNEFENIPDKSEVEVGVNYSQYLFWLHYQDKLSPKIIFDDTLYFASKYNAIKSKYYIGNRNRDKLRIGYVSGDFYEHVVVTYFEPIIAHHDRRSFDIYCYSNHSLEDYVSLRIKDKCSKWVNISELSDDLAADLIRDDDIDILVDLSGHTARNRLGIFARKPARIQMSWIGYFNTTGIYNMDYIVSDSDLIPEQNEHLYTETPLKLELGAATHALPGKDVSINTLPALESGVFTLGCYATERKYNSLTLRLWAEVLKRIPRSRILLKSKYFEEYWTREKYHRKFEELGIERSRVIFSGSSIYNDYLADYGKVDLMLGTFPYNTATTCIDALWMGVPEVSLRGEMLVSRISGSLHHKLGLDEFIADTHEDYAEKAVGWSNRLNELSEIRATLRGRMEKLSMANPKIFTEGYEAALTGIWRKWCEEQGVGRDA